MQKRTKIEIAILVILIIIWAVSILAGQGTTYPKLKVDCQTACHQIGSSNWTFTGAGPVSKNLFSSEQDCISACQAKFVK